MRNEICRLCGGELSGDAVKKLGTPVADLGLSTRALNCLKREKIETVERLLQCDADQLMRFRGVGKHTADQIIQAIGHLGFTNRD